MQYRLSTLLVVVSLSSIVAAVFSADIGAGIFAYIGCLSLFLSVWRVRAVILQRLADAQSGDLYYPFDVVLDGGWAAILGVGASMAFLCAAVVGLLLFEAALIVLGISPNFEQWSLGLRLLLFLAIGTVAVFWLYWVLWPRRNMRRAL